MFAYLKVLLEMDGFLERIGVLKSIFTYNNGYSFFDPKHRDTRIQEISSKVPEELRKMAGNLKMFSKNGIKFIQIDSRNRLEEIKRISSILNAKIVV